MNEIIIICKDKKELERVIASLKKKKADFQFQGLRVILKRDKTYKEVSRLLHMWYEKYDTKIYTLTPLIEEIPSK